jgi:hypothetical protein
MREVTSEGKTMHYEDRRSSTGHKNNNVSQGWKTALGVIGFAFMMLFFIFSFPAMMRRPDVLLTAELVLGWFAVVAWVVVQVNKEKQR